jgi:hypothetical protein
MARKTLRDDDGNTYDVELPDDDADDDADDDEDTLYLDQEDIEWLQRKRREEAEQTRQRSSSGTTGPKTKSKVVKIRAKQSTSPSQTRQNARKRVLRLA